MTDITTIEQKGTLVFNACALSAMLLCLSTVSDAVAAPKKAKPPKGLDECSEPYTLDVSHRWPIGERIRYGLWLDGLAVGSVEFGVANQGNVNNIEATEFVSRFKVDELVAALLPVHGEAHSIVPVGSIMPLRMWNDYFLDGRKYRETFDQPRSGMLKAERVRDGSAKVRATRELPGPILDFVSGFYVLRSGSLKESACTLVFGSHRVHTVHLEPLGNEDVATPIGQRPAEKLRIRYGAERSKVVHEAFIWVSTSADRLPYRVEIKGKHHIIVKIDMYDPGQIAALP